MASDLVDGDYLGSYRRFIVDFVDKVNPNDQLPIKTSGHDVSEGELVGEIIHMTLQYLNQPLCPPSLQCYIVQLVIEEIKATCRKQPESCGFRQEEKTYEPLKLMQAVASKVNEICQRYLENSRLALLPPPPSTPMPLANAFAIRNNRRKMEDRHVILHDLNTIFNIKGDSIASYYAVFDGHAGYQAAVFCATHLHQYLAESPHYPTDPERALRDAFTTADEIFVQKSSRQTLSSGTTAVCALILNKKLYVAWAGDSQAALAKRGDVTQLVNPHKPDRNDERDRVEQMGGYVMHLGIWRVNGNLAVSRAIGDAQYKPYVTGDPEIRCITLDGDEDFLIIGCDGLWDCVTENEAAALVYRDLYRDPYDHESASQHLVEFAKKQGSIDNITVIVVFLASPLKIASRSSNNGNPLLADVQLDNMEPDNRFVSNANGQFDVNSSFGKQNSANNGSPDMMDDDDPYLSYANKSTNGKHVENGGKTVESVNYNADVDEDDLGPETDVDAVDDGFEDVSNLANVSRQLFPEKQDLCEIYQSEEPMDDDTPASPQTTKTNQRALIPESDNVGDSEDSEDEWNYYRIDPNKEKEEAATAPAISTEAKIENDKVEENVAGLGRASSPVEHRHLLGDEDNEDNEEKNDDKDDDSDSSSEPDSEREIRSNALIDNEISADEKSNPVVSPIEDSTIDKEETKKFELEKDTEVSKIVDQTNANIDSEEDMDFQLNPDAAEFVPVSPTPIIPTRMDLDAPIAGSPLKQTSIMDDIAIPSRREFENEVRSRPCEIEEKSACKNGDLFGDFDDDDAKIPEATSILNLDESEVSSTKAEFGDESSFMAPIDESQKTVVSNCDNSWTGSYPGFDDSAIDPMTKSFGPGDFLNLANPVDLNAVHDLPEDDFMTEDNNDDEKIFDTEEKMNLENIQAFVSEEKINLENIQAFVSEEKINLENIQASVSEEKINLENIQTSVSEEKINLENIRTSVTEEMINLENIHASVTEEKMNLENIQTSETEENINLENIQASVSEEKMNLENIESFETEEKINLENIGTSEIDNETSELQYKEKTNLNPFTNDQKSNDIMDVSSPIASPGSPINQPQFPNDFTENQTENPISTITESEKMSRLDEKTSNDFQIDSTTSKPFYDETMVTSKLLEMDLEDRGSQDCGFEKCNEKLIIEDENLRVNDDVTNNFLSSPILHDDYVESATSESLPIDSAMIDNSEKISNTFDRLVKTNDDEFTENSAAPQLPILLNPLNLHIENAQYSQESGSFEDIADYQVPKAPESPIDIISPLVQSEKAKNNPFETPDFGSEISFNEQQNFQTKFQDTELKIDDSETKNPEIVEKIVEPCQESLPQATEVASTLKLSESLQEFTGLEEQLKPDIPTNVSNGLESKNLLDINDEESKSDPSTMEEISNPDKSTIEKISQIDSTKESPPKDDENSKIPTLPEPEKLVKDKEIIAAATTAVTTALAASAIASTTQKPTKTKSTTSKTTLKSSSGTKTTSNKSTPTSPTKPTTTNRTSTLGAAKKSASTTSTSARPTKLDTGKTSTSTTTKSTLGPSKTATTTTTTKPAGRLSAASPRTKPAASSIVAKTSTTIGDKKSATTNGDATKSTLGSNKTTSGASKTTTKPSTKSTTTRVVSSASAATTATTAKARPTSAATTTNAGRTATSKITTGNVGTTTQRPKTAPTGTTTSLTSKSRPTTTAKSPITDKQIKETANKQISSSRTSTTTTASKTSRTSVSSSTTTATRRVTASKTTSTTSNSAANQAVPPPIRKPAPITRPGGKNVTAAATGGAGVVANVQPIANGKNHVTKMSNANAKTKIVVQNGVCTETLESKIVTSTTSNEDEDVPKKDVSPVEPTSDNQLIVTAD